MKQDKTPMMEMGYQVMHLLLSGRYTAKQLGKMINTNEPTIRKVINNLRCEGIPVCTGGRGYYISTDKGEIAKTIESLTHRIVQMQNAVDGLMRGMML